MNISYCAVTNRGRVRGNNEDNLFAAGQSPTGQDLKAAEYIQKGNFKTDKKGGLFCVCDGMGGMNAGEAASQFVINAVKERQDYINSMGPEESVKFLDGYLSEQSDNLYALSKSNVNLEGTGTTFVGLNIKGDKAAALNVGDSRCYLFRKGKLYQLTTDHSEAERLVKMGLMKRENVRGSRERSMLYRYIGTPPEAGKLECAVSQTIPLQKGDMFLLCSDGMTDMVEDLVIAGILNGAKSPDQAARMLIDKALANGGADNVTVIVLKVGGALEAQKVLIVANIVCIIVVIVMVIFLLLYKGAKKANTDPDLPSQHPKQIETVIPKK